MNREGVDLSIITISTNELHELKQCLKSFFKYKPNYRSEIIVIDNNSNDNTYEFVKSNYPEVKLVKNPKKLGFATNNNIGIKMAKGKYILLMNPDIILKENVIDYLIDFMEKKPDAGVVSCKLLNPDGTIQYTCRKFPTFKAVFLRWLNLDHFLITKKILDDYLMRYYDHNRLMEVDWVLGAFLMAPRKVIERVGYLDEDYDPLYYEDIDLCYRIKMLGYKIYYVPQVSVIHLYNRESAQSLFNKMTYYHFRNILKFLWKRKFKYRRNNEDFID